MQKNGYYYLQVLYCVNPECPEYGAAVEKRVLSSPPDAPADWIDPPECNECGEELDFIEPD